MTDVPELAVASADRRRRSLPTHCAASSGTPAPLSALRGAPLPADAAVLVGPEGGWTEQESQAAHEQGVRLVTLGHRTLRADAVPIAAISVLQFLWGDF